MDTELLSKKFGQMGARVGAMEALQPRLLKPLITRRVKRVKDRLRRKNKAFVRQREWLREEPTEVQRVM